ncbi:hypothetical protein FIU87_19795 [Bacillus sp. THAF10]|uniref:DUF4269 domain-containing protein n=1 Tax=Bacillus sp. THAF10 TaxID=2587848 RepID=UPI0012AA5B3C|nr:DUF4269 domain-containing protein [Bacillus sp. THAF10]QFT90893.1 hypothetical protein FIU87_19795 [Bacillus sp. THAF10]
MNFMKLMKNGNTKQQRAYEAIIKLNVMHDLGAYHPTLCGTIPINIDLSDSDLDIIMETYNLDLFEEKLISLYESMEDFRMKRSNIRGREVVKCNFYYEGFEFELFGQGQPVNEQYAYLHMVIEHALLEKTPSLRAQVIDLKKQGYKTEPAFCEILGISGDPYEGLLKYGVEKGLLDE